MAEKRRLFIDSDRLIYEIHLNGVLELNSAESHYLSRVMRMRPEDLLEVIDGKGRLWDAKILGKKHIKLLNTFDTPLKSVLKDKPLISLIIFFSTIFAFQR